MILTIFIAVLCFLIKIAIVHKFYHIGARKSIRGRHVLITGGSSGIGKAVAILSAQAGAHVTILARDINRLAKAKNEIEKHTINKNQIITTITVDVTKPEQLCSKFKAVEQSVGPIFMLVNCAGFAICGKLEDLQQDDIEKLISINLLGTIYPIRAVLSDMKQRKEGIIVITSSLAGLCGLYGMSAYCASKFALKGLAESLSMELKPYNVSITMAFPPDTDTPGFVNENLTKPDETKLISQVAGLIEPEAVAKQLLDDALGNRFFSYLGQEGCMLTNLCAGMSPINSIWQVIFQLLFFQPLKLVAILYNMYFSRIIKNCVASKVSDKKIT